MSFYGEFGTYKVELDRRGFIRMVAFSGLALLSPSPVLAAISNATSPKRSLYLYNPNTRESVKTTYWLDGEYVEKALDEINHIMRDRYTGQVKPIDPRLLDLLHSIGSQLKTRRPFHIISGYRSPKTNARLLKYGRGASKTSLHMHGKAVDIRLPGCRLSSLRRTAVKLRGGGVGYYPRSRHIHIDVGPVRYWARWTKKKKRK